MEDFLGFNIYKSDSDTYHLSQPKLINQIVSDLGLSNYDTNPKTTAALATNILGNFQDTEKFDQHFHYRSFIGKLNYLENSH